MGLSTAGSPAYKRLPSQCIALKHHKILCPNKPPASVPTMRAEVDFILRVKLLSKYSYKPVTYKPWNSALVAQLTFGADGWMVSSLCD
jgi:hypothetical protein